MSGFYDPLSLQVLREGIELAEKATPGPFRRATDAQGTCGLMHPTLPVAVAWFSSAHVPINGYVGDNGPIGRPEREATANLIEHARNHYADICRALLAITELADAYLRGTLARNYRRAGPQDSGTQEADCG